MANVTRQDVADPAAEEPVEKRLESHRIELTGYCYRMLGSAFEAEDAVQETMVRAWKGFERFEGRASMRSWLYRIATNVCFDMHGSPQRRARPMDLSSPGAATTPPEAALGGALPEATWLEPMPDTKVLPEGGDPAEVAAQRDSVRLAFVAALQHLPPRQRVVLILRDVLAWKASEVADLLETSVASVNSALQRARATLATEAPADSEPAKPLDADQQRFLERYVDAFERYDLDALTALMREDVILSMPPLPLWLQGPEDVRTWFLGTGSVCRGSRLVPCSANGMPAFAQYHPDPESGGHRGWAIQVLEIEDGKVTGLNSFLSAERLFPLFGLPLVLEA